MTDYGCLPFKHDPVARFVCLLLIFMIYCRYELYKREWTRLPIPGEQRRQTLRWKVGVFLI
jgi:hypothetical protein